MALAGRTRAIHLIDPYRARRQRRELPERLGLALRVNANNRHLHPHAGHGTRHQIALRPRRAHLAHAAGVQQRRQRTRDRGLADAQVGLQLGAGSHTAALAQGVQGEFGQGFDGLCGGLNGGHIESLYE